MFKIPSFILHPHYVQTFSSIPKVAENRGNIEYMNILIY